MNWDSGVIDGMSHLSLITLRFESISNDMNKGGTALITSFSRGRFYISRRK